MPRRCRSPSSWRILTRALFTESNPVPVKYALDLMGLMSARVRLPLWAAAEKTRREVREALRLWNPDKGFFRLWFRDDSGVEG